MSDSVSTEGLFVDASVNSGLYKGVGVSLAVASGMIIKTYIVLYDKKKL